MSKKRPDDLTVDEINAEVERIEQQEAEMREDKRRLASARAKRIEFDAKVVRFAKLKDEEIDDLVKDEKLKKAVVEYKAAAADRPKAKTAAPEPVLTGAKVRK